MQARHVMSSPVTTVDRSTSVDECLRLVGSSGFTVLPVVESGSISWASCPRVICSVHGSVSWAGRPRDRPAA